jgi:hypothetical protein
MQFKKVFSNTMISVLYWRNRFDPLFSKNGKGEKLWYLLAMHWNTSVLKYIDL